MIISRFPLHLVPVLIVLALSAQQLSAQRIIYVSPVPNSVLVSCKTNIILRCEEQIDEATLAVSGLDVTGSRTGAHTGTFRLSDDGQTLIFTPDTPFAPGEQVSVSSRDGVKTRRGLSVDHMEFSFATTPLREPLTSRYAVDDEGAVVSIEARAAAPSHFSKPASSSTDSLPSDFPKYQIDSVNTPSPGYFFFATADYVPGDGYFIFMINNAGQVVRYKRVAGHVYDFKQQPNGFYSYAEGQSEWVYAGGSRSVHRIVDSTLAPVDSVKAGNGYDADSHEFRLLPNGHALLHAYDIQYFDLSTIIPGGNPNAIVVGSILQELDLRRNVVFQWRSWDYIPIADTYMSTKASAFDYIHVNAYDLDDDGNILASFRNTCEIVKINRMTGEMLWRMGGKHNQFTFIGENDANKPTFFTYQHCIRRLPNGNFILFDNGNLHPQKISRAVEYRVDQINKTATLVWEYRHTPDIFAPARGSVQRLPNGNTVIGWGQAPLSGVGKQSVTEVRPDKSTAFEMEFLDVTSSYRALKFVLNAPAVPVAAVTEYDVLPGNTYSFRHGDSVQTGVTMLIRQSGAGYNNIAVKRYESAPSTQSFSSLPPFVQPGRWTIKQIGLLSFTIDVTFDSIALAPYSGKQRAVVYTRDVEGQGTFTPLTSVYDSAGQRLTVTVNKFGEFIIGIPENVGVPVTPTLIEPSQNARVNQTVPIMIHWNSYGHITGSHLQVATDSLFASTVVDDSTLKSSAALWSSALPASRYFWRVQVHNEKGQSGWSTTGVFATTAPFVEVVNPTAGAKVTRGSQTVIRWESNIGSFVSVRLLRNGTLASKLIDSTVNTGRLVWIVDSTSTVPDTTYTVRVLVVGDSTLYGESRRFSIISTTGVEADPLTVHSFSLEQNYPNPFNPLTTIRYALPRKSSVTLSVYTPLGQEVQRLVSGEQEAGIHDVRFDGSRLSSGVYLYRIRAGDFVQVRKLLLLK